MAPFSKILLRLSHFLNTFYTEKMRHFFFPFLFITIFTTLSLPALSATQKKKEPTIQKEKATEDTTTSKAEDVDEEKTTAEDSTDNADSEANKDVDPKNESTFNLGTHPIYISTGLLTLFGEFKVADKWSIYTDFLYISSGPIEVTGLTAQARYYFKSTFKNSWFIYPGYSYVQATIDFLGSTLAATSTGVVAGGGYRWIVADHFNISVGLEYLLGAEYPHLFFPIGWVF